MGEGGALGGPIFRPVEHSWIVLLVFPHVQSEIKMGVGGADIMMNEMEEKSVKRKTVRRKSDITLHILHPNIIEHEHIAKPASIEQLRILLRDVIEED